MVGLARLAAKIFGTPNERKLKPYRAVVPEINAHEAELRQLGDEALRARTDEFRRQVAEGKPLDELLVPAFATVREAAWRTLQQRHFDVQLIGGMVLHDGRIAEMKTGEGKTLVATLAVYLNALAGKGVHVVTVNDYLAKRDSEWMGQIYRFLGLTVGCIVHGLDEPERRAQYACDVTYGTNNELGFDYLRDNMKTHPEEMVQRGHHYAIVDEVDSILIDEARTPLIISGAIEDRSELYNTIDGFIPRLEPSDYEVDEKLKSVTLTEVGNERLENVLREAGLLTGDSLYDAENVTVVHHVNQALRAHKLFQKDRDYIVKDDQVVIIDEFTGRMMPGRRYSEGLHQALEAKEHASIQPENQTLASITFQNYFRMYAKLAGMTGTAATEADEFMDIYKLDVVEVPSNMPIARSDEDDEVYRTAREKYHAIIELIRECQDRRQPVLVGTTSIEKSELLAGMLDEAGIQRNVLNARYHEQEAAIVAQAGVPGTVTIATNMAGRGTDIQLGGNADMRIKTELAAAAGEAERHAMTDDIKAEVNRLKEDVIQAGGLYIIGTERHESRRIDNQLRGRSGRQGDPGRSKFFLSLEDDLMRIFGSERMDSMLQKLGLQEGEAITHPWINKALEKAQQKVEARNFDARKNILRFDDVMNNQRKVIYEQRIEIMSGAQVSETVDDMRHQMISELVAAHMPENAYAEQWDTAGLRERLKELLNAELPVDEWAKQEGIADEEVKKRILEATDQAYAERRERFRRESMGQLDMGEIERRVLLGTLDHLWRQHLITLDHLRQVIGLRAYGQRDPLNEYKSEAFTLFEALIARLREDVTGTLNQLELVQAPEFPEPELPSLEAHHIDPFTGRDEMADAPLALAGAAFGMGAMLDGLPAPEAQARLDPLDPASWGKVGRNAPCPCGSGKKFKHCHGAFV